MQAVHEKRAMTGLIGGRIGYEILKRMGGSPPRRNLCSGEAYANRSKLEALLGEDVWRRLDGKTVLDFGCGTGAEVVEMAQRGVPRVIGLDLRASVLVKARQRAQLAGVAGQCLFTTEPVERVDVIISLDAFEHFADPAEILRTMAGLLKPGGRILAAFGPPWYHPIGGHGFSVFPWAHLVFSERTFMRWWAEFKTDGATRFSEIDGGLNQMSVGRFRRLVDESGLVVEDFSPVPIRRLKLLWNRATQEFFTSVVRCRLVLPGPDEAIP
jgi:SAM-dependent methyltransferase